MVAEHGLREEWKIISTHPEYSVSNTGYVKNNRTDRILMPRDKLPEWAKLGGYVCMYKRWYPIAYLVYVHFIGPRPRCHVIQVNDTTKAPSILNVRAVRLPHVARWTTPGQNPKACMLPGQVKLIKHLYLVDKLPVIQIADCLGLSTSTVYNKLRSEGVKFKKKNYV